MTYTRRAALFAGSALLAAGTPLANAQSDWPNKPIRLVVPFPPGGSIDPLARMLTQRLTETKGWKFVIENRAGASGSIGTAMVAKAAPDGYTFGMVFDTHTVNPSLIASMPFDTQKDLVPVMAIGTSPMVLSTHASRPLQNIDQFLAAARRKPEALNFGTTGNGTLAHLTMKQLERHYGFTVLHVPYKGGAPLLTDAVSGTLDTFMTTIGAQAPHIAQGKMRPLAITGDKRVKQLPDVPTFAEKGYAGFSAKSWWGIVAPAGTPAEIVTSMNREIKAILTDPAQSSQLEERMIMEIWGSTPQEMRTFVGSEIERWKRVIAEHNIKID